MNYIIITGASKGLGEAAVEALLKPNYHLITVARTKNEQMLKEAKEKGTKIDNIQYDLNNVESLPSLMDTIFSYVDVKIAQSIHFINNAGILQPMKPIEKCNSEEITKNINVNLIAPMILVSEFIKKTTDLPIEKRVINISSGAGKSPIFGWGCYGASKAGVDLFSQTVGIEENEKSHPVKITSFAPGIVDTGMQKEIRSTKKEDFAQVDKFIDYKEEGKLLAPSTVAKVIVELLEVVDFPTGKVTSVKEYL
ncbi:(S)-benzoin forming benzil reductase [Evansella sp. AB-P1]|uniref:(S)-benzoin forming benzil reductase n=1 Tax=Evansella sp. AB-P1 TaxID=3037653 RepID=UPI00241F37CF|nr:(S)-benzoin forming benzil reductase [Evansella sp. AB-P1]MDG5786062.1 (S)-benzoin forming benzil reductase [Evansella sp. AB-P1]